MIKNKDIGFTLKVISVFFLMPLTMFSQQTRKVLFLGNSYTYANNLPQIVADLATNTGDIFIYDSNSIGGYTLQDHASSTVSQNLIVSNDWDYIVLQEQSQRPSFPVPLAFFNAFAVLKGFIKQNKPCAQISSFMTWGYQNGDAQNCVSNPAVCTYAGMDNLIRERYMEFSDVLESEVTPVGVVWRYIRENYPGINLYESDGSHPSLAGSYLAACCFYTSLFRKDPTLITNNYGLSATTAAVIRNATKSIVYNQMSQWYIGRYVPNSHFNYIIGNGSNEVIINNVMPTYRSSVFWEFGDGATSTALLPTHSYAANGTYTLRLTSNKCYLGQNIVSVFERIVNFCSHANTIFPNNLILCPDTTGTIWTQPADSYQWLDYLGNPIPNATNQSLEVYSGYYSVLTTINGCTERSPDVVVDGWMQCDLGNDDFHIPQKIIISPNPVANILNIQTQETITEVLVYDILGKEVTVKQVNTNSIDVSRLLAGLYIIKVMGENDKTFTAKFIKE